MKKFFITVALAVAVVTVSFAADGVKIDKRIQTAFQKEFAEAFNPRWESIGSGIFHVTFTQNSEVMDAYYNEEGRLVSLSRYVSKDQLPILVNRSIDQKLKGAEVSNIRELVDESETSYLVTAKKENSTVVARVYTTGGFHVVKKIKNGKG